MTCGKSTGHKICISFLSTTFVWNIFCPTKYSMNYAEICTKMRVGLLLLTDFKQNWKALKNVITTPQYKFYTRHFSHFTL
jgi:hypothetical protein